LAITDLNKELEINPNDAYAYGLRGQIYDKKGDLDQGIADSNKAIEISPNYAFAYSERAWAYLVKGDYDKSWADVYKVESLGMKIDPKFLNDLKEKSQRDK
jgi:tetratricopeptide (TPR) repeat protein